MSVTLVVAAAHRGVIGRAGTIPWHVSEDMKHFRAVTTGHAIIMGRKTWDSIGRPLPNRRSIVVSRNKALPAPEGVEVVPTIAAAIELAKTTDPEPCVIGGSEIYTLALPFAETIHLTELDWDVEDGDTFFVFDRSSFVEVSRRQGEMPGVSFVKLEKKR